MIGSGSFPGEIRRLDSRNAMPIPPSSPGAFALAHTKPPSFGLPTKKPWIAMLFLAGGPELGVVPVRCSGPGT